mmetsp:Transcript_51521/g.167175  ORF Transcript_51521/g.167175 Transcript_51521/m.167175 type:complete len:256 (-) Transcript_51521:1409-2176(-)
MSAAAPGSPGTTKSSKCAMPPIQMPRRAAVRPWNTFGGVAPRETQMTGSKTSSSNSLSHRGTWKCMTGQTHTSDFRVCFSYQLRNSTAPPQRNGPLTGFASCDRPAKRMRRYSSNAGSKGPTSRGAKFRLFATASSGRLSAGAKASSGRLSCDLSWAPGTLVAVASTAWGCSRLTCGLGTCCPLPLRSCPSPASSDPRNERPNSPPRRSSLEVLSSAPSRIVAARRETWPGTAPFPALDVGGEPPSAPCLLKVET